MAQTTSTEASAVTVDRPKHHKAKMIRAPRLIPTYVTRGDQEWFVEMEQDGKRFELHAETAEKALKAAKPYLEGEKKYGES